MDVGTESMTVTAAPSPKSPPKYPDLCGRRRLQLEVQILNREIGFLEEELQSLEGLQPVSGSCKEVEDFLGSNPDPLVPIDEKQRRSYRIWKWLRSAFRYPFLLLSCSSRFQKKTLCFCCSPPEECICSLSEQCCCCSLPRCLCDHPCRQCWCTGRCSCSHCCKPCCTTCCDRIACCSLCSTSTYGCDPCCCWPLGISCCKLPQCPASILTLCLPWRWSCCCSCSPLQSYCCWKSSCTMPRPSCPRSSCGCIWSCPRCTGERPCHCSGKTSCISGCLC